MTHFCFAYYRFRVYFANYKFWFRFVSQTTVSSPYESTRNKQQLDDDIKAAEAPLHADAERELWNIREVLRTGIQNFRFVISPPKVFCGLWWKRHRRQVWSASLLQLSCINRTVLLFFSFLFRLHSIEFLSPTNNFLSSHVKLRLIFAHFHHHVTYSLYRWERLPTWLFFYAVISAPDHWIARTRKWRFSCVERNNLPSVFPFSEFSNPGDF